MMERRIIKRLMMAHNLKIRIMLLILLIVIAGSIAIGYGYGYTKGSVDSIKFGVNVLNKLVEHNKINITIDEDMLRNGIMQYKNNIGGCLFIEENALIFRS